MKTSTFAKYLSEELGIKEDRVFDILKEKNTELLYDVLKLDFNIDKKTVMKACKKVSQKTFYLVICKDAISLIPTEFNEKFMFALAYIEDTKAFYKEYKSIYEVDGLANELCDMLVTYYVENSKPINVKIARTIFLEGF